MQDLKFSSVAKRENFLRSISVIQARLLEKELAKADFYAPLASAMVSAPAASSAINALQTSDAAQNSAIVSLQGSSGSGGGGTVGGTVTVAPYVATSDDYTALSTVFGAVLAAAAVIWGVKRLYHLLNSGAES